MDTYSPQKLPFFPRPYPGESLYSVLCRYHVRSGNATAAKTIRQLFGGYASLSSTLLLPSMTTMNCFDSWLFSFPEMNWKEFIFAHTAFSLCSLQEYTFYRFLIFEENARTSVKKRMHGVFSQARIQHLSQELRYCPICAAEQKKIYGESYWQIIPQLDGVEYCPFHHTRILSSSVHARELRYSFFPADMIIPSLSEKDTAFTPQTLYPEMSNRPDLFISMAACIQYMWENLPKLNGIWSLHNGYRQLLSGTKKNKLWLSTMDVKEQLLEQNHPKLVNWLLPSGRDEEQYVYFGSFSLAKHAMLISMLSPSPEAFFAG